MKKLICACLLLSVFCFAQITTTGNMGTLTATGTGTVTSTPSSNHTLQIVVTGSPSACTVRLEGSLDGTNWADLSGTQTCTSSVMFHVDGKPVAYVRANLLTWTGGTNAVITYRGGN